MLYIVSGYMRSGTSMMMDALSAGMRGRGIPCVWSRERDEAMNRKHADGEFQPNESYREIALHEYQGFDFPKQYDGSLIKIMSWGLSQMRRIPHRLVFMTRNPMEIAESMERAFGEGPQVIVDGMKFRWSEYPDTWRRQYWAMMKQCIQVAELRVDCTSFRLMDYADVLANPQKVFENLSSEGWPIDVTECVKITNPKRKRVNNNGDIGKQAVQRMA